MKKVFISQPMRNKTRGEIEVERAEIIFTLKDKVKDFEIIDSVCKDFKPDTNPLIFLAKAIEFLSQADVVVMGRGWNEARGCKVEELCAREYGKEIIYM